MEKERKVDSALELAESREDHRELAEQAEEKREASLEADKESLESAIEENVEKVLEDVDDDVAEVLSAEITKEQIAAFVQAKEGLQSAQELVAEGGEVGMKALIEQLVENRYEMSLEEFLGRMKPTAIGWLNPSGALANEAGIWIASKMLDVEPADASFVEKASTKLRTSADGMRALGFLAHFVPGAGTEAALGLDIGSAVAGRIGESLHALEKEESPDVYGTTKDVTLALLPRDEKGNIDSEKASEWVSATGKHLASSMGENAPGLAKSFATAMEKNPEAIMNNMKHFDTLMNAKKAA